MKIDEILESIDAYHGSRSVQITGELIPSTSGRFGPGIYASLVPGVAGQYGRMHKVISDATLFDAFPRFLSSEDLIRLRQKMFSLMSQPEQIKVAEWWPQTKGLMTGEDIYEIVSRRLGMPRTQEILKQMGFEGITGIGDGQEICVFEPRHIRLIQTG